ncbi:MAG: Phage integrase SAM-like protein [Mucilaginibacter sp.]|nr:Phage integrase SAM-like protein [Mucilaginibacter sp.]
MATVCSTIFKHHLKTDGSYNVKIRVFHKKERRYIDTVHYVSNKQLTKDLSIKDPFINRQLNKQIDDYRIAISELGERLNFFSADALKDHLLNKNEEINFIKFSDDHIMQLKKDGRGGTAYNHSTVRISLVDYFGREKVSILEITVSMLKLYERFLRNTRNITRINQLDRKVTIQSKGVTDSGLYNYMRDLRTLFNAAREKFNDEDLGIIRIPHYPFNKYKVGTPPQTAKRNMPLSVVKRIQESTVKPGSRAELARDLFMLSFYMCGLMLLIFTTAPKKTSKKIDWNITVQKPKEKGKIMHLSVLKLWMRQNPYLKNIWVN